MLKITPFRVHHGRIHFMHLLFINQMKTFELDHNRKLEKTFTSFRHKMRNYRLETSNI